MFTQERDKGSSPPFVKRYSYEELEKDDSKGQYSPSSHGFSYELRGKGERTTSPSDESSSVRRSHAHAFNYAPGLKGKQDLDRDGAEYVMSAKEKEKRMAASGVAGEMGHQGSDISADSSGLNISGVSSHSLRDVAKDRKNKKKDKSKSGKKESDASTKFEDESGKKKKKKFGFFGGKKSGGSGDSKGKQQQQPLPHSSSSDDDSSSDESVVRETREAAQPQDIDSSMTASERERSASSTFIQASMSPGGLDTSTSTVEQSNNSTIEANSFESSPITYSNISATTGDTTSISSPTSDTPKIVKTTTKKTFVQDNEGVSESIVQHVEDVNQGQVSLETQTQKVSSVFLLKKNV